MLGKTFLAVSSYDGTEPTARADAGEYRERDAAPHGLLRAILNALRAA